jgi:hypothetical protein
MKNNESNFRTRCGASFEILSVIFELDGTIEKMQGEVDAHGNKVIRPITWDRTGKVMHIGQGTNIKKEEFDLIRCEKIDFEELFKGYTARRKGIEVKIDSAEYNFNNEVVEYSGTFLIIDGPGKGISRTMKWNLKGKSFTEYPEYHTRFNNNEIDLILEKPFDESFTE